ncbi:hypothetical protein POVWA1_023140 [Plasmodium ovale wallikeri]|nr:hypothetical protein POVWA1_023140 [Plasmodium ovale wallikeri]
MDISPLCSYLPVTLIEHALRACAASNCDIFFFNLAWNYFSFRSVNKAKGWRLAKRTTPTFSPLDRYASKDASAYACACAYFRQHIYCSQGHSGHWEGPPSYHVVRRCEKKR